MKLDKHQRSLEAHKQRLTKRDAEKTTAENALLAKTDAKGGDNQKWQRGRGRGGSKGGRGRGNYSSRGNGVRGNTDQKNGSEGSSSRGRGDYGGRDKGGKSNYNAIIATEMVIFKINVGANNTDEAKLAQEEGDKEETLLMVTTKDEGDNGDSWFLDTGCSTHMTGRRNWFVEFDDSVKSQVRFADDRTMGVEGTGKVMIRRKGGNHIFITGVLYVP